MKKTILLTAMITLLISCVKSKEEQLLYDYQAKGLKETLKVLPEDVDFKITKIEKVGEIKCSDSIKYFKKRLVLYMSPSIYDYLSEESLGTLNYTPEIRKFDSLVKSYRHLISLNISLDREYANYKYTEKLNDYSDKLSDLISWKKRNDLYSQNKDSVLSVKYKASYTQMNPLLKIKQTFERYYYTNSYNTKIIAEEEIK